MVKKNKDKKIILVIEDERALLKAIKMKLEKNNFHVITSRSVERAFTPPIEDVTISSVKIALEHLEKLEQVDAIWLDHYLPGEKTGLDFVAKLKDAEEMMKDPIKREQWRQIMLTVQAQSHLQAANKAVQGQPQGQPAGQPGGVGGTV